MNIPTDMDKDVIYQHIKSNQRMDTRGSLNKLIVVSMVIALLATGCTTFKSKESEEDRITIAEQFGLAYAPLQIMKEQKLMEKNLPGIEINWRQLGNTAAIREAMLANEVDTGFMAIPPFLIGWDKGMQWKIAVGLSSNPVGLVTNKSSVKTIKDFSKNDRIALPQPGSVQHILLSMACEREFGDARRLDDLLVTLAHPDGVSALAARKEITAHFTAPPYLFKELEMDDMHQIMSGKEAMGKDFTFIVGVTTNKFHDENPEVYKAFIKSINEAIEFLNENPGRAASMLSKIYNVEEKELYKYLTWEDTEYSQVIKGIDEFAQFMKRNGYISKVPKEINDVAWEDAIYEY